MRILAIDPSPTSTGLTYPDKSSSTLPPPKKVGTGPERLVWLREAMRTILDSVKPHLVVVEDYALGMSKPNATIPTCEWGGTLRLLLFERKQPYILMPPQCWKTYCTGKGNAGKPEASFELTTRSGLAFRNYDESDSFGIAATANHYYGDPWIKVPADWVTRSFKQIAWPEKESLL